MFPAKKILCPTDFSEAASQALSTAADVALHNQAEIYLIHVSRVLLLDADPAFVNQLREYEQFLKPQEQLERLAKPLLEKGLRTQIVIGHGDAAGEIVRIAEQKSADIIVIATHGKTGWRRLAFGSVAEKVVRTATCPVLVIRWAGHGASGTS
jgi:nucleotide-binding universal stress UspA family protein